MNIYEIIVILLMAITLAEVSYLVLKAPRRRLQRQAGRSVLIDTSVLMDGRIVAIAKTGFLGDHLVVPRSVIGEMQFLADNADADKRGKARQGLDTVSELQQMPMVNVTILQDGSKASEGVDERLLTLAKKHQALICTLDFNLNKVAIVEGIQVLNINELAQTLRMAYLPGEQMSLMLVQKGQDSHQAVGYLHDGTMVVVEQASSRIGQTVEVEIIRSLQTTAGRMMFAKLTDIKNQNPKPKQSRQPRPPKPQDASGTKPRPQQPSRNTQTHSKPNRRKSSSQREADLINLVNGQ